MVEPEKQPYLTREKRTRLVVMSLIIAACAVILFLVFYNGAAQ